MIGKAKACTGGSGLFNYVVNDEKGYELTRNGMSGETAKELFDDMKVIQQQNLRCTNNTISIVLSPTVQNGNELSDDELKAITEDFLKDLDICPQTEQYIAFIHTEKEHKHIHLILNRVQDSGKLINDNFIGKRAQHAAHRAALKHGLVSARDLKYQNQAKQAALNKNIKANIKKAHQEAVLQNPKNIQEYKALLLQKSIELIPTVNKQGTIQGYRFLDHNSSVNLKASEVDRNIKLNILFKDTNSTKISLESNIESFTPTENKLKILNVLASASAVPEGNEDIKKRKKKKRFRR